MALIRWAPKSGRRDVLHFNDEFDRWFDGLDGGGRSGPLAGFEPAIDIEETQDAFVLRADLPGVSEKDIKVSMVNDKLTIRGERKRVKSNTDGSVHRVERVHGSFERSFKLGTAVRNDKIKANYKDGVLEIRLPKVEEAKEREIEIRTD